jgi:hypothetical protein
MYNEPIRVIGESAPQQLQAHSSIGVIIDWFERNIRIQVAGGIIRDQFGERFSFTERDVVSGEPKVGHKVSFIGHPAGVSIAAATKVVVDPQIETQSELNRNPESEIPQLVERVVQQAPQQREFYGRVKFWAEQSKAGVIEVDETERYPFSASDVVRGIPQEGAWAKFHTIGGRAVAVELA